jgi:CDP-glucose 4,6-dehydratase
LEVVVMNMTQINCEFWSGKKVFLTGHTGFKGGWLSLWLASMGAKVIGYALPPPTNPSFFDVVQLDSAVNSCIGDIRNFAELKRALHAANPEIIFHLAAQPLVRRSYIDPIETYETNVMGTVNLFEAARSLSNLKAIINVTSDKCYENKEWVWPYRENEPMGGYDPYSSSKGCSEIITSAFRNSFFNPELYSEHGVAVASARAGNVIGGGDWAEDRLVPDMLRTLGSRRPVALRNPDAVRPWQHVLEPLAGYLMLAQSLYDEGPSYSGAWNFGPNNQDAMPVLWIAKKLSGLMRIQWEIDKGENPHEAHFLRLDSSKAKEFLGWSPRWNLDDALQEIVLWHKSFIAGENMREQSISSISSYLKASTNK